MATVQDEPIGGSLQPPRVQLPSVQFPSLHQTERYHASTGASTWRRWGDEIAVYEAHSAQTHLLVDGHAEVFGMLTARTTPASLDDLADTFTGDGSGVGATASSLDDSEREALRSLVHDLVTLGLVDTLPA